MPAAVTKNNIAGSVLDAGATFRRTRRLPKALGQRGGPKKSQEMVNYVVVKVTNVKVNEHGKSEWNTGSRSFSGLLHRVNTFVINFHFIQYIIHLINFSEVQNLHSYLRNVGYNVMICRVGIFV